MLLLLGNLVSRFRKQSHSGTGGSTLDLQSLPKCPPVPLCQSEHRAAYRLMTPNHPQQLLPYSQRLHWLSEGRKSLLYATLSLFSIYLYSTFSGIFHLKSSKTFPWIRAYSTLEKHCTDSAGCVTLTLVRNKSRRRSQISQLSSQALQSPWEWRWVRSTCSIKLILPCTCPWVFNLFHITPPFPSRASPPCTRASSFFHLIFP